METNTLTEEEVRLQKLKELRDNGIDPFPHIFHKTHSIKTVLTQYQSLQTEEKADETVVVAGRIMAKRGHGKAAFGNISDESGRMQYYANINVLGEEKYEQLLQLDVGDFIGITGTPFVTKRGELSVAVVDYQLLSKALHPLPEKFHGLQDKELRYRHRYVDLIVNDEVKTVFRTRSEIIFFIRKYLVNDGFIEVETPVLHSIYGGAAARPFKTFHNELDQHLYLRIATELHLKRLVVGGFEKVFEIGRIFRNEGVSYKHNPEFTSIELYQAYSDYEGMMQLTETLLGELCFSLLNRYEIEYQGVQLNLKPPYARITMAQALEKYAGTDANMSLESLQAVTKKQDISLTGKESRGELINTLYDKLVEPQLIQPTFILDYPWETSPLAKRKRGNPDLVERFELIINGMEIANAFSELNDPIDQHDRFEDQLKAAQNGYEEAHQMDEDYVLALKYGMPPTGGLGIGIDRVAMLLTDSASIRDVILFPHMKSNY